MENNVKEPICESCFMTGVHNIKFECHKICNRCIFTSFFNKLIKSDEDYNTTLLSLISCCICNLQSTAKLTVSNFLQNEQIFAYLLKPISKRCDCCQIDNIEVYCNQCEIYYCRVCIIQKHLPIKKFKNHSLSSNIDNYLNGNICRCLKNRKIQFICNSCDDYFCINCILLDHNDHNFDSDYHNYDIYKENIEPKNIEIKLLRSNTIKKRLIYIKEKILSFNNIPNNSYLEYKNILIELFNFLDKGNLSISEAFALFDEEFIKVLINNLQGFLTYCQKIVNNFEKTINNSEKRLSLTTEMAENIRNLTDLKLHPKIDIRAYNQIILDYLKDKVTEVEGNIYKKIKNSFFTMKNDILPTIRKVESSQYQVKLVFKGQSIKKLQGYTIAASSKMAKDSYPNVFVAFKNYEGRSFVGWINYYQNHIELFDYSTGDTYLNHSLLDKSINKGNNSIVLNQFDANTTYNILNQTENSIKNHKSKHKESFISSNTKPSNFNSKATKTEANLNISTYTSHSINKNIHTIYAHTDTIYCLRHYIIDREHFLLTCSKDNFVKLWECKYFTECFAANNKVNARSGIILKFKNIRYIVVCSYTKDYPINAYDSDGNLCRQFEVNGYSYHLDFYEHGSKTFLFNSAYPYVFCIYDFESCCLLYSYKTASYINSVIVTPFKIPLVTILDRTGCMTQFNLISGDILRENSDVGYYGMCKWNEKYYVVCGKDLGLNIIDINTFTTVDWYNNLHKDSIRNVVKYRHPEFGDVLLTYGEDQVIKLYK